MDQSRQLRIAVVMGGVSSEREISLASGRAIAEGLSLKGYRVEEIVLDEERLPPILRALARSRKTKDAGFDVVFLALHGRFGEDGQIQALLEKEGIPYTGSGVKASERAMDKLEAKRAFLAAGVLTPPFRIISDKWKEADVSFAAKALGFPVVLKPVSEGSSIGVHIVSDEKGLLAKLATEASHGRHFFLEKYIAGRELTVGILEEKALPIVEICPSRPFYDFNAKYDGGTNYLTNPPLPSRVEEAVKEAGLAAHQALGCRHFSRVDMRLERSQIPYVLEVNTIPGFTSTSLLPKAAEAAGISFPDLCARIVEASLNGTIGEVSADPAQRLSPNVI